MITLSLTLDGKYSCRWHTKICGSKSCWMFCLSHDYHGKFFHIPNFSWTWLLKYKSFTIIIAFGSSKILKFSAISYDFILWASSVECRVLNFTLSILRLSYQNNWTQCNWYDDGNQQCFSNIRIVNSNVKPAVYTLQAKIRASSDNFN